MSSLRMVGKLSLLLSGRAVYPKLLKWKGNCLFFQLTMRTNLIMNLGNQGRYLQLVLGASLPNLPHYQMNLQESQILEGQVEELLSKGQFRESVSSCTVPTLLTPKNDGSLHMCGQSSHQQDYYQLSIPYSQLDDMFDMLSGSETPNQILRVDTTKFVSEQVMNGKKPSKKRGGGFMSGLLCHLAYQMLRVHSWD